MAQVYKIYLMCMDISFSKEFEYWSAEGLAIITIDLRLLQGLTATSDKVHDLAPLMKDFPLNELLSTTELDKVNILLWL